MIDKTLKILFIILLLAVPLSMPATFSTFQINLPSEPLVGLIAILLFFRADLKELYKSAFLRHPISLCSIGFLLWMILVLPFSSDHQISAKYIVVTLSHWWVFYVGFWVYRDQLNGSIHKWMHYYALTSGIVLFHSFIRNIKLDFRLDANLLLAQPFFSDHALFSSVLSLLMFFFVMMAIRSYPQSQGRIVRRVGYAIFCFAIGLGIYYSHSRAAWLSLVFAFLFGMLLIFRKISFKKFVVGLIFTVGAVAIILPSLLRSDSIQAKAREGGWWNQIKSTLNFHSDVSNLERLNRYSCAWRMFLDRPITGFGAGTFSEAYLPYQNPSQMTRISVTSTKRSDGTLHAEGTGGGAHSEYLQALSELGLLGFIFWIALVGAVVKTALKVNAKEKQVPKRLLTISLIMGLSSYFIHSLFNNFLHQEELSILFWGMIGSIIIIDLEK